MQDAARQGHELIDWAETVAGESAVVCWHDARLRWLRRTARLLAAEFEAEAAQEFIRTAGTAEGASRDRRAAELRGMRDAVELLGALAGTLGA